LKQRICDQEISETDSKKNMKKTFIVVIITSITMVVEIIYGLLTGSMALLADGIHMGTHTFALIVALIAYVIAAKHEHNPNFTFSSGKIKILGGYTNAIFLGITAIFMITEAVERFIHPENIMFNQALIVAVAGLAVNLVSAVILSNRGGHGHDHHHDHNMRAAYIHVITDAMTSVLAITALLFGKFFNLTWPDAAVALLGAAVIIKWAINLILSSGKMLVDYYPAENEISIISDLVKNHGGEINDIHLWQTCEKSKALILKIKGSIDKNKLISDIEEKLSITHLTLEII
jgi:cation diffusion facilitator family transporter